MARNTANIRHKYKAKAVEYDGIRFDSQKEGRRYQELKLLQRSGDVIFFLRQVPFDLPGNTKYRCDFLIFWKDGNVTFEEVKGYETETWKMKKRIVEDLYPVEIEIT